MQRLQLYIQPIGMGRPPSCLGQWSMRGYMNLAHMHKPSRCKHHILNLRLSVWGRAVSTGRPDASRPDPAPAESPCSTPRTRPDNRIFFLEDIDAFSVLDYRETHKLYCTKNPAETNSIIKKMIKEGQVFGLDLEWRPTFVKGSKENKTALIQLCNAKSVLLIQISRMGVFPYELKGLLQSRSILKTGVNIRGDALKLYRDFRILTNGLVDLGALARTTNAKELTGYVGLSLKLLCGIFLGKSLPKGPTRLSRWDAPTLSSKQRQYAADDAYASFALYKAIEERRQSSSKSKIKISHLEDDKPSKDSKPIEPSKLAKATASKATAGTDNVQSTAVAIEQTTEIDVEVDANANADTENITEDHVHLSTTTQSTIIVHTSTSMPFQTTELLKKKES